MLVTMNSYWTNITKLFIYQQLLALIIIISPNEVFGDISFKFYMRVVDTPLRYFAIEI